MTELEQWEKRPFIIKQCMEALRFHFHTKVDLVKNVTRGLGVILYNAITPNYYTIFSYKTVQ